MATELEKWARTERDFLREDIQWLKAGGILKSPSGEDIRVNKIAQLEARLEHVLVALRQVEDVHLSR